MACARSCIRRRTYQAPGRKVRDFQCDGDTMRPNGKKSDMNTVAKSSNISSINLRRRRLPGYYVVFTFVVAFGSALLLGLSSAFAIPGIAGCIVLLIASVAGKPQIPRVAFFALLLVFYTLLSAFLFGGIRSLFENGALTWLAGEGRFFIYYWPFIFLTVALYSKSHHLEERMETSLVGLTVFAFFVIVMQRLGGLQLYSSHHAAGAVLASLVVFNYCRYENRRHLNALFFLGIAVAGMLGTGSRASLMAAIMAIVILQLIRFRVLKVVKFALVVPILLYGMLLAYPEHFERLAGTFSVNPLTVVSVNFERAWHADPPLESSTAWSLSTFADQQGQANLAIRGLLWARGVAEGLKSPIIGTGFGRYNDVGREVNDSLPLVAVVTDATFANPSTHSSHNSFIMIFTELGLIGVLLLGSIFLVVIRTATLTLWQPNVRRDAKMWAGVALGCTVNLMLVSVTQHGFGAPIYGLTLMQLIALGYCISATELKG